MPPPEPLEPPEGDIAPYPDEVLTLGGNRWLSSTGHVLTHPRGVPCELQPNTLKFWEAAAQRGGYVLQDLRR